jgi:hypothetical protein
MSGVWSAIRYKTNDDHLTVYFDSNRLGKYMYLTALEWNISVQSPPQTWKCLYCWISIISTVECDVLARPLEMAHCILRQWGYFLFKGIYRCAPGMGRLFQFYNIWTMGIKFSCGVNVWMAVFFPIPVSPQYQIFS